MFVWQKIISLMAGLGILLFSGCNSRKDSASGRLYYTVSEVGCTRIEWTDVNGTESHHVLGVLPVRDEFASHNVNSDNNESLARNSKYVSSPRISYDGTRMICLYGKNPAICIFNLKTNSQEGTIKADGSMMSPCFGATNDEFFYIKIGSDNRCHLMHQIYPKAPTEIIKTRNINGLLYCDIDKFLYYSDVSPDGYTVLKKCDISGNNSKDVLEGASYPVMPRLGSNMLLTIAGKLNIYGLYDHKKDILSNEAGIVSACWDPMGKEIAYVLNDNIYRLTPGEEPILVPTPNKKVIDVFWAKGL